MTKRPKRILATIIIFLSLLFTFIYIDDIQKWFNQYTDKLTQNHKGQGHSKWEDFFRGSRITEIFGKYQHSPFDGKHYGIDFALPKGTPIKAPTNGKVTRIFNNELGGKVLQIAEDNGEYHQWYLHLDKYNVKVGDRVKAGDIIAYSGNTGKQTTGAHLHFQRMKGGVGNAYAEDPKPFIDQLPDGERSLYDL
ncbi:TPA: M23 family metallopeptidase [Staphylococcus aureus]|nr:M23 family metallopeptidase [Staphylococcus aureus]